MVAHSLAWQSKACQLWKGNSRVVTYDQHLDQGRDLRQPCLGRGVGLAPEDPEWVHVDPRGRSTPVPQEAQEDPDPALDLGPRRPPTFTNPMAMVLPKSKTNIEDPNHY